MKRLEELNKKKDDLDVAAKKEAEIIRLELKFVSIHPQPTIFEMAFYCYCHIGILTGPYFKYRTYRDWLYSNYSQSYSSSLKFMYKRSKYTLILLAGFLVLSKFVSFNDPNKDDFYENPLWYRLLYMPLIFTLFRFRFYIAWIFVSWIKLIKICNLYFLQFKIYSTGWIFMH